MAILSNPQRLAVAAKYMADEKTTHGAVVKDDIRAALNALDDFFEANAAAINNAIPQPARGVLTTSQKSRLVRYLLVERYP